METKIKNRILGIIASQFNASHFYDFVVDSYVLGKENFDYFEFKKYFQRKVLQSKRFDGTTYDLYSPVMEQAMMSVFSEIISKIALEHYKTAYDILKAEGMYQPFQHIASFEEWHGFMCETLLMGLEDTMGFDWGYEDEDCGCPDCMEEKK
jgi:hypothetical protein